MLHFTKHNSRVAKLPGAQHAAQEEDIRWPASGTETEEGKIWRRSFSRCDGLTSHGDV